MKIDPSECHPAMDYNEHQRTYGVFIKLVLWAALATAVALVGLAVFVA